MELLFLIGDFPFGGRRRRREQGKKNLMTQ